MSATAYPDLPGLEDVYLEGSPVERLVVSDDIVVVVTDLALLGDHPDYVPPARGEVHCREVHSIVIRRPRRARWHDPQGGAGPWTLDGLEVDGDRLRFRGSFGRIDVDGGRLQIKRGR